MLGSTLLRLAHIPGVDGAQMSSWIHDSISKLEEALEISKDDHEAMYLLATTHYKLFTRVKERYEEFYDRLFARADEEYDEPFAYFDQLNGGFYVEHCRKAYGYFKYLKEKAPEVYERDPDVLNRIQRSVPRDMLDSNLDYKSDTETMNTIDPGLSQKMEEEEMIQEAVEKLIAALPYDDNSELIEMLAEFSHRHKKKSKTKQLASF